MLVLVNGAELVTNPMTEEPIRDTECRPSSSCFTTDMSTAYILEIRGFSPVTTKDTVDMFIENKSGGIELQALDYDTKTGVAVATFRHAEGNSIPIYYSVVSCGSLFLIWPID